jgi:predicted ArsR family transcriptional regulator
LYDYVRRQDHPVGREEAAEAVTISRSLAAFHLDKLVEVGLLGARYEAPIDRPRGRGRAPKVYEAPGDGFALTIPQRQYELMADILAEAVEGDPARAGDAAGRVAHQRGNEIGAGLLATQPDVVDVLAGLGFEPRQHAERVLLQNCPFHALAARHTALVCGLNHRFVDGLLAGLGVGDVETRLAPRPDACCVELTTAEPPSTPVR